MHRYFAPGDRKWAFRQKAERPEGRSAKFHAAVSVSVSAGDSLGSGSG